MNTINKPQPSITSIFMSKNNKTGSSLLGRFSKKNRLSAELKFLGFMQFFE
jgi:hypothetical protein